MDSTIRTIKSCLLKIFSKETLNSEELKRIESFQREESLEIDEIATEDLIIYTIPFINGVCENNKEELGKYIDIVNDMKLFENRKNEELGSLQEANEFINSINSFKGIPLMDNYSEYKNKAKSESSNSINTDISPNTNKQESSISIISPLESGFLIKNSETGEFNNLKVSNDIKNGILNRNDKIFMFNKIKEFQYDFIDWDDKEYLKDLLKVCFYKALLLYRTLQSEELISKKSESYDELSVKPTAFTLMPCGHLNPISKIRKELFKRRINPNMTLDEYADKIMKELREREDNEKPIKKNKDVTEQRKNDDEKDILRNFKGNTKNIS